MKRESIPPENKYISLFASHHVALWEYDCPTSELSFINNYFYLLKLDQAGIQFSDINGLRNAIHPDDLPVFNNAFEQIRSGSTTTVAIKYRLISPTTETVWLEEHLSAYSPEKSEKPEKIIFCTQNITQEQLKEEERRQEREKYHALLNAMAPNFIFIFTKEFVFHDIILPEGLRLFNNPEELIGQSAHIIYSPEVSELFIHNINESLQTGELRNIEYHIDLLGKRFYYQAHIVPYQGDKAFALIQDISDRVRRMNDLITARERAEEADRMKTAFLANMSHEIRTPLNAIVGFSEIIAEDNVRAEDKKEFQNIIQTNSDLLLKLINDILDLSRIESGKSEIIFQDIHLASLLNEIKQVHQLKMPSQISFKVHLPSEDVWLNSDSNRIKQILYNFLSNAVKNTKQGSITLGVKELEDKICFFVSDTGCGIPPDQLDRIFERFEKINSFIQGTGLGLSICTSLAKRLGGSIEAESQPGEGSTFYLSVPYEKEEPTAEILLEETNIEVKKDKRPTILIAENTEEDYQKAQNILLEEYRTLWARNKEETIRLFKEESPNLILMSIQLPSLADGLESAQEIRKVSQQTPIIGLTSRDFYMEQKSAMENGYSDVIPKPYSGTKLKEVIVAFI